MTAPRFLVGETITVREVLHGRPWLEFPEKVAGDDDILATVQADGCPLTFHDHPFGPHPWSHQSAWQGSTVLKLRRPGEWYSVWRIFAGPALPGWYVNFETPYVRRPHGIDINDLQLDLTIPSDGDWRWKDVEDLAPALASGRVTDEEVRRVLAAATDVAALLGAGDPWWLRYEGWTPA